MYFLKLQHFQPCFLVTQNHNSKHAWELMHGAFIFLNSNIPALNAPDISDDKKTLASYCTPLEKMALLFASMCHDYKHPGVSNDFLKKIKSPEAITYNNISILENFHAAESWKLYFASPSNEFLCNLNDEDFEEFRELVITLILATDLKKHQKILTKFETKAISGIDLENKSDRILLFKLIIKLVDLSNPTKRNDIAVEWARRIQEEIFVQGDKERAKKLPISAYCDRNNPKTAQLQVEFIRNIVKPSFVLLARYGYINMDLVEEGEDAAGIVMFENFNYKCLHIAHLEENLMYWQGKIEE